MVPPARTPPSVEQLLEEIRAEFPRFRIVDKQHHTLSRAIDRLLRLLTFGGQREYLTRYHTVIGYTLYTPLSWARAGEAERAIVLRHERVHLRQRRRLGLLGMAFVYLVPILPLGLAWGRARLEWEAYAETLRATVEHLGWEAAASEQLREQIVTRFTGPDYGWMWPFRSQVEAWYSRTLAALREESAEPAPSGGPKGPHP